MDPAGVGVRGEKGLDQLLQLGGERIAGAGAGLRDDVGEDDLAAQFVGLADDRGLGHGLAARSWVDRLGGSGWWSLGGLIAGTALSSASAQVIG